MPDPRSLYQFHGDKFSIVDSCPSRDRRTEASTPLQLMVRRKFALIFLKYAGFSVTFFHGALTSSNDLMAVPLFAPKPNREFIVLVLVFFHFFSS